MTTSPKSLVPLTYNNSQAAEKSLMNHIRCLAVYVDEPEPSTYHWVLHEFHVGVSTWTDVLESEAFGTWREAYDAGAAELMSHVADDRIGPR